MKALVLTRDTVVEYRDVADPVRPGPGWALIRVEFSGICASDLHRGFEGGAYHYPLIMGHEFAGTVEEPADGGRFPRGARVAVFPLIPCRRCLPCQTGDFAQCTDYDYLGSRRDGAFAERVWAPEANLFAVPDGVSLRDAAMTEPCAVALHGVGKLSIQAGDIGAVFGAGPIGNMAAQWMRRRGCQTVFMVDIDDRKLALAAEMGFSAIDSRAGDPVEQIRAATGGRGADRVVEAIGLPLTFLQAVQAGARFAEVVFLGNIRGTFQIGEKDFSSILRRELTIRGTWNSRVVPESRNEWTTVLSHLGAGMDVSRLVSHTPPLSEGADIFRRMLGRREFFAKVVFSAREGSRS
ncbi:MAG TPA: galactitol-1-phosphate 5-dehydrogenase [Spirochaetia bacterium]|nr:galactitol-1-phosphate 5-dehydrogenase [Spirochaetia bacterium]HTZ50175.1 galactitol-1-phosphate 5-dehydrogenase [Spirochaetia bacterium]